MCGSKRVQAGSIAGSLAYSWRRQQTAAVSRILAYRGGVSARDFCNADELGCREAIKHVDELLGCFHTSWVWLNMVYGYWLIQIDCRLMEHEDNGP